MIKWVVDNKTDKVLGAHLVSEHAVEISQSLATISKGVSKQDFNTPLGLQATTREEFLFQSL